MTSMPRAKKLKTCINQNTKVRVLSSRNHWIVDFPLAGPIAKETLCTKERERERDRERREREREERERERERGREEKKNGPQVTRVETQLGFGVMWL